ncbi:MAG: Maf family protein [Planctomycetaceae bacterium]|nr:Maf family protein [Planctomycetaceae bacterium]
MNATHLILGSRSPRRLELLSSIIPREQIEVLPPRSSAEAGFELLHTPAAIEQRLREIVRVKGDDVLAQVQARQPMSERTAPVIVVADTIVIAQEPRSAAIPRLTVLGQPAEPDWQADVRTWFRQLLSDQTHEVWTGFRLLSAGANNPSPDKVEQIVRSTVTFESLDETVLDWYISTEESRGKAGGYAIQGLGAALVRGVSGSLTNVIGLPIHELRNALRKFLQPVSKGS